MIHLHVQSKKQNNEEWQRRTLFNDKNVHSRRGYSIVDMPLIYAPNIWACRYIQQIVTDIKGKMDGNTIIGNFNTPFTSMDRASRQKINKAQKS